MDLYYSPVKPPDHCRGQSLRFANPCLAQPQSLLNPFFTRLSARVFRVSFDKFRKPAFLAELTALEFLIFGSFTQSLKVYQTEKAIFEIFFSIRPCGVWTCRAIFNARRFFHAYVDFSAFESCRGDHSKNFDIPKMSFFERNGRRPGGGFKNRTRFGPRQFRKKKKSKN